MSTTKEEIVEELDKDELEIEDVTSDEQVEELDENEQKICVLEAQINELKDSLLREQAEVENFKRRMKQENENNLKFANQSLIEDMLPVLDAFDRALNVENIADENVKQFVKGFDMIDTLLIQILTNAGLEKIPSVGEEFDPYLHQAVMHESIEGTDDNIILEELQTGYRLKDRVIRASMVKVNKK